MNNSVATILGIIALIGLGIFGWWAINKDTDTPTTQTPTTTLPTPGMPVAVTSQSVIPTDTTAIFTGSVTPTGALTSYWYEYGKTPSLGSKTAVQVIGSGFSAIPAPLYVEGLSKVTTYYFRLSAQNQFGTTAGAQYSFQTTEGNPAPVGSTPTIKTLAASGVARTTADINGEINPNGASTQYWFEYGQNQNLGLTTTFESVGNGVTKLPASISLSGLSPNSTYYFRLNAQNQFGTVNGTILNFKTAGPVSSSVLPSVATKSATGVSTSSATLHGTLNPNGSETTYWFEYSTDPLLGLTLLKSTEHRSAGSGSNTMSFETNVSLLLAKTNYHFRLVAQNGLGISRGDRMTFKTK